MATIKRPDICESHLLDYRRDSLAHPDAHRGDTQSRAAPAHLVR
jgi:hypothetical protein